MSVTAVAVEASRHAAEAAIIDRAAIEPPIRTRHRDEVGAAIASRHKTQRYRADRSCPHHGQDHTARAFHDASPQAVQGMFGTAENLLFGGGEASKKPDMSRDRAA
jgi:hypothetical protein